MIQKTIPIDDVCPNCAKPKQPDEPLCPRCGFITDQSFGLTPTGVAPREMVLGTNPAPPTGPLGDHMTVVFQFLPSGTCISHGIAKPLVMGRTPLNNHQDFLDLADFKAAFHRVSRQHCRFWRLHNHLLLMDLGSTNGTYLNGTRLIPGLAYVVRPDNRLILGSLHVVVTFA